MAQYRVVPGTLSVNTTKEYFLNDEVVQLRLNYKVERTDGAGVWFTWWSKVSIFNKDTSMLIHEQSFGHAALLQAGVYVGDVTDEIVDVGMLPEGLINLKVVITAGG